MRHHKGHKIKQLTKRFPDILPKDNEQKEAQKAFMPSKSESTHLCARICCFTPHTAIDPSGGLETFKARLTIFSRLPVELRSHRALTERAIIYLFTKTRKR